MTPSRPCPVCGGRSFATVKPVRMELISSAKKGFSNVVHATFTMVVCTGCGASTFHSDPDFLHDVDHTLVTIDPD